MDLPKYSEKDDQPVKSLKSTESEDGWWITDNEQVIAMAQIMTDLITKVHQKTHIGTNAIVDSIRRYTIGP